MRTSSTSREPTARGHNIWVEHPTTDNTQGTLALQAVDVEVNTGEVVAIIGPSGSGKSTLLHTLSGFTQATRGRVELLGNDISDASASEIAQIHQNGVGFIFQQYNIIGSLSVLDNILLPARFARQSVDTSRAMQICQYLGMEHRINHRSNALSGGEQQRVAVARALYQRPRILFADEPTGALDTATGTRVLAELRVLADTGSSVVLVTHDLNAAAGADRAIVLTDGHIHATVDNPSADHLWQLTNRGGNNA